ncbi:hypothetical protein [Humisphaera borealis]|uniref:Uncharacterized protein n=1 Tax=Humisphaera borealis TaxID=2807512 RepID=A0A7M2WZB8_9BACT|nr:hypothetical protein [Humisphaera borealis]QOV90542.1 hypothetical protein IPV69_04015 [Humisphaera borealis]
MAITHGMPKLARTCGIALCLAATTSVGLLPKLVTCASAQTAVARYPEPSFYPVSWELNFRHQTPKRIVARTPGDLSPRAYWYMTYTVSNAGNEAAEFDPVFEMLADNGKTYRANRAIPNDVFEAIKKKEGIKLLESPKQITGIIKPGPEQAKDGVAIWPEPLKEMGTFSIFAAGLSGETVIMKKVGAQYVAVDPKKAAEELKDVKDEDRLLLRKQYSVTYRILGDDVAPGVDPIEKKGSKWVMR